MSAHAIFAPSSADRWMACPGSFGLSLQLPRGSGSSEYAEEGTRLHEVASEHLLGNKMAGDADWAFLAPYTDYCLDLILKAEWHAIETRIEHSQLLFGTADFMAGMDGVLHVVDLKCGQGIMVRPDDNKQLLTYAYMELVRSKPACKKVRLTIVQPHDTAEPVKHWDTTAAYVMEHGAKVEQAIQNALQGATELVAGEHCRWCPAKPVCPRLRGLLATLPASLQPAELSPLATAELLDKADLVLTFIDAVRAHGHDLASRGIDVPGYMLKPKRATRQWADEGKVLEIARRRKIKIWQDKLLSPAMAEKAHPDMPEELKAQIVAISSGYNLVKGDAPKIAPSKIAPDASPMERLMANFETLQYRK